jgi:hypothetical protein
VIPQAIREIRRAWRVADKLPADAQPRWIHLPIAQAPLPSRRLGMPRYCEARRCQGKRRTATTFHALIDVPGTPDYAWVACADCTGLMIEGAG